ncbi:MAG TPA: class II aldolase/adducin family protein [Chloroflexota bacterium]|nr:class II aldolase/adducin family protein [Chloroflexota bacterium]
MNTEELAQKLTTGCRILAEQDIVDAFGHLSARLPGDDNLFLMNRGISPALVTPEDFIVLDLDGNVVGGNGTPNAEWPIHACIYRARPDVNSVLHSHQRLSRIFSLSRHKLRGLLMSNVPEWQEGLPVYRGAGLINSVERGDTLARTLGAGSAALLRGHGDVVATGEVARTVLKALNLKENADVLHELLSRGEEPELWSPEDVAAWAAPMHVNVSREAAALLATKSWDYYEARVNGRLAELLGGA